MAMQLENIVPFGRSLEEYTVMFSLTPADLQRRILGVADGPASFNAQATAGGTRVLSVDPLYAHPPAAIRRQFDQVVDHIIDQVKASPDDWVWSYHRSPDHLKANRVAAIERFIADFPQGQRDGRYLTAELPSLGLPAASFDLALCSHFLFLYSDHLNYEFHMQSMLEMLRVAAEVRVFPLLTLMRQPSPYLNPLIQGLTAQGFHAVVEAVPYELQKGGRAMLRVTRK